VIEIYTDGACRGNPGPGGWAALLQTGEREKELHGAEALTTNNRMELTAAIEGLRAINQPCEIEVITDSEYVKNGITQWIHSWKRNNWITSAKKPVLNSDLWRELDEEVSRHKTTWTWTKGHAAHDDNNRADELAAMAAREQRASG
jgi:ribonuclease HI